MGKTEFNIEQVIADRIDKLDAELKALETMTTLAEIELRGLIDLQIHMIAKAGEPIPVELTEFRKRLEIVT
jgi:hypothetical protein